MISRRDLVMGGACVAAAGLGVYARPHKLRPLLTSGKLAAAVPAAFGGWTSQDMGDPLAINGPGTLSAKLYNELIAREYINEAKGIGITMLLAYGGQQSDELQLHRPEVCYPAFGYALTRNEPLNMKIGGQETVPARRLIATQEGREEHIIYWSRIGEFLPQDGGQQRSARFRISLQGIIPDGLLARFSMTGGTPDGDWTAISDFITEMLRAFPADKLKVIVGTERANQLLRARAAKA